MPRLTLLPLEHPEDIEDWTDSERAELVRVLAKVANGEIVGPTLNKRMPGMPVLVGCRKLYVLGRNPSGVKMRNHDCGGCRVIYRIVDRCVEVIAIGSRLDNVSIFLAGQRLGAEVLPMHYRVDP